MTLSAWRKAHPGWNKRAMANYYARLRDKGLTDYQARKLRKFGKVKELSNAL